MIRYTIFSGPFCDVILAGDEYGLGYLHLATEDCNRPFEVQDAWVRDDDYFAEEKTQVLAFLAGELEKFSIKLNLKGTDFQKKVWAELLKIPFGETRSYKEIAIQLGAPNSARAVGMANSKNPVPLVVPCHRVINTDGKLAGFAHGIKTKQHLLDLESRQESAVVGKQFKKQLKFEF